MRVAEFIRARPDEIEAEWEKFARSISTFSPDLDVLTLRDHLREILIAIADDMATTQSLEEQAEKSRGTKTQGNALDRISAVHARVRLNSGFNLEHAISEYRALRSSILFLWIRSQPADEHIVLSEVTRFNETIDQCVAEVVRRFADKSEHYGDVFLGVLTHEVRNPLNVISLSGEILKATALEEPQTRCVERILRGARNIERLVNDLAILVRSRMRVAFPLTRAPSDLGEICTLTLEEVKTSHDDAVFELEKIGDLKGDWEQERLAQVVFNLVTNAVIHADAKQVQVTVQDLGPEVVLRVTNQGASIPSALQESIFDPFVHQETESPTSTKKGLGLGLFIVKEIVTGHQGTVEVASTEAEGTTFTVRLPRSPDPAKN
jgi:signal transduction histidine kinase